MWGPGQESMWHEYNIFVVKAMVSCIAILADQGLRLDFLRANINDWERSFQRCSDCFRQNY
jgi:hypothetical protein